MIISTTSVYNALKEMCHSCTSQCPWNC